jgi:hypothetical protein
MVAGESQITVTGDTPVVNDNLSGADFVFVGGIANVPAFYVMATAEIRTVQYGVDYIAPIPYPTREGIAEVLKQSIHPKPKHLTRTILLI